MSWRSPVLEHEFLTPFLLFPPGLDGIRGSTPTAEEAFREARLYAESIVNTVRDPLVVLDRELRICSINQPFSALFRVSGEAALGESLPCIGGGVWNHAGLLVLLRAVLDSGESMEDFELPFEHEGLGTRALRLNARTLHRSDGARGHILVIVEDITERKRIQALLQQNEDRLREDERIWQRQLEITNALRVSTVGELAVGLAHELNQPLASISNLVEACTRRVRAGTLDQVQHLKLLADLADESMRAAGIIAHLRSFVDKGEPQFESVDLTRLVARVPRLLLREFDRTRITLRTDVTTEKLLVDADPIQIEQVVVNLLQNAMDSVREAERPQRLIELSVKAAGGMAEVGVRDTGTGVSELAAGQIFAAFYTTKAQGLGMGLALSRSILEAHRGRIWFENPSDGGPGTVVRFAIPRKDASPRREEAKP